MKITILGSGAAEAIPNPFCKCRVCEIARQQAGRHIRARASALVNDDLLIDCGPDLLSSANKQELYLGDVQTLLMTHKHSDHWLPDNLTWREVPFAPELNVTMDIYGPLDAMSMISAPKVAAAKITFNVIKGGTQWQAQAYTVTAIPASHGDGRLEAVIYAIDDGTSKVLYGTDTGSLGEAALDLLADLAPIDVVILDDTFAGNGSGASHHGNGQFLETRQAFIDRGILVDDSRMFAHHFSHNGGMTYDELVAFFEPHEVDVTYDGLVIES